MTDERAALIESLARGEPCAADACLSRLPDNCQCAKTAIAVLAALIKSKMEMENEKEQTR